ncbi:hypothetical protein [Paenibacillus sp. HJGM_3]|uniref:hypothetical protein n=1 Tax=Paenibacillus sp. HJGM_3 TaxID=3379816 RepID=UPI00385D2015
MNKRQAKLGGANAAKRTESPRKVVAPSLNGGADKEYMVVFEKKAVYNKPSFAR